MERRRKGHQRNGRAGRIVWRAIDPENIQAFYPGQAGRIKNIFGVS